MSLKKTAASGVRWTGGSTVVTTAVQFIQLAVLARLLAPEAFGLMAMILIVTGFAQAFADMGISNAVIHKTSVSDQQLSSLYWLNIMAGAALYFILLAATPAVVWIYDEPRLQSVLPWAAAIFLIVPVGQLHQVLLRKHLDFRTIALISVFGSIGGLTVAVVSAVNGYGVLSLIFAQLGTAFLQSVMYFLAGSRRWRPEFHFVRNDLDDFLSFGLYQMGERTINYFLFRVDQLIIGAMAGAQALGYYNLAYNLSLQPLSRVNPVVMMVAFPLFAKVQTDDERLKRGYMLAVSILAAINYPICLGLIVVAPTLVPLVFGDQWHDAVILVQILSLVALLRSTGVVVGSLILAKGRADLGFKWNLAVFTVQVPSVFLSGYYGGVLGVAVTVLVLQSLYFIVGYWALVKKAVGPCLFEYASNLVPSFVTATVMALGVALIPIVLSGGETTMTFLQIGLGAAIYVGLTVLFRRKFSKQLLSLSRLRSA